MTSLTCKMCPEWNHCTAPLWSGLRGQHCPIGPDAGPGLQTVPVSLQAAQHSSRPAPPLPNTLPAHVKSQSKTYMSLESQSGPSPRPLSLVPSPTLPHPCNLISDLQPLWPPCHAPVAQWGPAPGPLPCCCPSCNTLQIPARLAGLCLNGTCARRPQRGAHVKEQSSASTPSLCSIFLDRGISSGHVAHLLAVCLLPCTFPCARMYAP